MTIVGIRFIVKQQETLNRKEVKAVELKLEKCRNQENNPASEM